MTISDWGSGQDGLLRPSIAGYDCVTVFFQKEGRTYIGYGYCSLCEGLSVSLDESFFTGSAIVKVLPSPHSLSAQISR